MSPQAKWSTEANRNERGRWNGGRRRLKARYSISLRFSVVTEARAIRVVKKWLLREIDFEERCRSRRQARPACSERIIFGNLCARPGVNCEYVIWPKNTLGTQVSIIGVCRDEKVKKTPYWYRSPSLLLMRTPFINLFNFRVRH